MTAVAEREDALHGGVWEAFRGTAPGHPLGPGMPPGRALRDDGESHDDWWMRVCRADPCAYCAIREPPGVCGLGGGSRTVDHIEAKCRRPRDGRGVHDCLAPMTVSAHDWLNLTGACESCNGKKRDRALLAYLRARRWNC